MKKQFFKAISALLLAALLLFPAAITEEPPVIAQPEEAVAVESYFAAESDEVYTETADEAVSETEADLDDADGEPDLAEADYEGGQYEAAEASDEVFYDTIESIGDPDALFSGYVDSLFGIDDGLYEARNLGGDLTGAMRGLYDVLTRGIVEVAAGRRSNADFSYQGDGSLVSQQIAMVVRCVVADYPYEMYWFDGFSSYRIYTNGTVTVSLAISDAYSDGNGNIDAAKVSKAATAAANAHAIVNKHAAKPDYDKLVAYRDEICNLVDYNHEATLSTWPSGENNPWQLIWVFDGDPATKVVCEGYAEAFQYLCDMSSFTGSVMCYCVTGGLNGGGHKWNIVRMPNGRNYMADITNCDQSTGIQEKYFMKAPQSGNVADGYSFGPFYSYDDWTRRLYTTFDLTLSAGSYVDEAGLAPDVTPTPTPEPTPTPTPEPTPTPTPPPSYPSEVHMSGNVDFSLPVGLSVQIVLDDGLQAKSYKSSNKKVAKVTSGGWVSTQKRGKAKIKVKLTDGRTIKLNLAVTRNKIDNLNAKPSLDIIDSGMTIVLKSLEITGPRKIVAEYWLVFKQPRSYKTTKFGSIQANIGAGDLTFVNGKAKNVKVSTRGMTVKKFKVTYKNSAVTKTDVYLPDMLTRYGGTWDSESFWLYWKR